MSYVTVMVDEVVAHIGVFDLPNTTCDCFGGDGTTSSFNADKYWWYLWVVVCMNMILACAGVLFLLRFCRRCELKFLTAIAYRPIRHAFSSLVTLGANEPES